MDPIGTVTKYYSFVDEETRKVLELVMAESTNLRDFVHNLGDAAIHECQSSDLIFLATLFARRTSEADVIERLNKKHGTAIIAKPWMIPSWIPTASGLESGVNRVVEAIEAAIDTNPEDWILLHLHLRKAYALLAVPEGAEALDAARQLVEENDELKCFEATIDYLEASLLRYEDNKTAAYRLCEEAVKKTKRIGDIYQEIQLLLRLAGWESEIDFRKGMDTINEAYNLSKRLGLSQTMIAVLDQMSAIAHKMGEYDLAIECFNEILEYDRPKSATTSHAPLDLSELYCDIEDGKQALELARLWDEVGESSGPSGLPAHGCPYYVKARALLLLDRQDEALKQIDTLHDIALRSGWEPWLSFYYHATGLYEIAVGDYYAGIESIERALESCERGRRQVGINQCLLALTKIEIDTFIVDENAVDPSDSGPWMARLEKEAREKSLHGILMQHALLKAEFQEKIKQLNAARDTLQSALKISDLPSVTTQRNWILKRLENLNSISRL
jgi:tetratricopeptide (TPR) repeat protein